MLSIIQSHSGAGKASRTHLSHRDDKRIFLMQIMISQHEVDQGVSVSVQSKILMVITREASTWGHKRKQIMKESEDSGRIS